MKDLLLVIDMQNVYGKNGKWACRNTEGATDNILKLLESGKFDDVIFTEFRSNPEATGIWVNYNEENAEVNNDEYSNEMIEDFKPWLEKYPLYSKSLYSSLANTDVLNACKTADRVFLTGVVAECCVLSTALALIDAGIYTVYVKDACTGLSLETEAATELVLSGLSPLHVDLKDTEELL